MAYKQLYDVYHHQTLRHLFTTDSREFAEAIVTREVFKRYGIDFSRVETREEAIDYFAGEGFIPEPDESNWEEEVIRVRSLITGEF